MRSRDQRDRSAALQPPYVLVVQHDVQPARPRRPRHAPPPPGPTPRSAGQAPQSTRTLPNLIRSKEEPLPD